MSVRERHIYDFTHVDVKKQNTWKLRKEPGKEKRGNKLHETLNVREKKKVKVDGGGWVSAGLDGGRVLGEHLLWWALGVVCKGWITEFYS